MSIELLYFSVHARAMIGACEGHVWDASVYRLDGAPNASSLTLLFWLSLLLGFLEFQNFSKLTSLSLRIMLIGYLDS